MQLHMPSVETMHLYLRPIEEMDACDMYSYCQDERVTKYLSFKPHKNVDYTCMILKRVLLPYAALQDFETLAILEQDSDKMIGHIYLHSLDEQRAQISYILHPDYWHKGYAREAVSAVVSIGFRECGLQRIEALYEKQHTASAKVLKSCGFQVEGTLREYMRLSDDTYHDMCIASILKHEYKGENTYAKRIESEI